MGRGVGWEGAPTACLAEKSVQEEILLEFRQEKGEKSSASHSSEAQIRTAIAASPFVELSQ